MQESDIKEVNIRNINNYLSELLKDQDLNFSKVLIHDHKEALSVTAEYDPPKDFQYLSGEEGSDPNDFYYGVSPRLDKQELMKCVSGLNIQTADMLSDYVYSKGKLFMMHTKQKDYLLALAKYIVVCMASHFGIRIKMDPQIYNELLRFLRDHGYSDDNIKTMLYYPETDAKSKKRKEQPKDSVLTIKGCPSKEVICFLDNYKYHRINVDIGTGKQKEAVEAWEPVDRKSAPEEYKCINNIYSEHVELIEGRVFYSGVLLKPTELKIEPDTKENYKIQSLSIKFERSTYGTVCAFDRNLTEHPALKDVKCQIIKMLQEDDRVKRALNTAIEQINKDDASAFECMKDAVNDYLRDCFNVNQIGVSANIVTSDGFLLIGQRRQANIDSKKLYPGVNGNAEVADKNVRFYSLSVYEDYPTIRIDSDRIDFFGEIGRETYAELDLGLPEQEWKCCGITLNGNIPKENSDTDCYKEAFRRMHFNLIFEQHTDKSFLEIKKMCVNAAEAFETERHLGVNVKYEACRLLHFLKSIGRGVKGIVNEKDFFEAVIALVMFLLTVSHKNIHFSTLWQNLGNLNWADILTLVLAVLVIIVTVSRSLCTLIRYLRKRWNTRFITIFKRKTYEDVNKRVSSVLRLHKCKKKQYGLHPATAACLRYYVDNVIGEGISKEEERKKRCIFKKKNEKKDKS